MKCVIIQRPSLLFDVAILSLHDLLVRVNTWGVFSVRTVFFSDRMQHTVNTSGTYQREAHVNQEAITSLDSYDRV